jgi:hypothetical protein
VFRPLSLLLSVFDTLAFRCVFLLPPLIQLGLHGL